MTTPLTYHLSNLAAGRQFDLSVADGADVLTAAQAHLEESGLTDDEMQGFYVSVYPDVADADSDHDDLSLG